MPQSSFDQDFFQWVGLAITAALAFFSGGRYAQKIDNLEEKISKTEKKSEEAIKKTAQNGENIARVEAKQDMTIDLVKQILDKIDG